MQNLRKCCILLLITLLSKRSDLSLDSNDTILFIVLIVLLALSAFFSSAETALTTVNRIRIRNLADEGNKNAQTVLKITDDSSKMLTAILNR